MSGTNLRDRNLVTAPDGSSDSEENEIDEDEDGDREGEIDDGSSYVYKSGTDKISKNTSDQNLASQRIKGKLSIHRKGDKKKIIEKRKKSTILIPKVRGRDENFFAQGKSSLIMIFNFENTFNLNILLAKEQ